VLAVIFNLKIGALAALFGALLLGAGVLLAAPAPAQAAQGCAKPPSSPLVVDVKTKGAKGDGRTDDTAAIQAAIDEVAGSGGTVLVPNGTYMVDAAGRKTRLKLKSQMTFKLSKRAILRAIPNDAELYTLLTISDVSDVTVVGGTLEGERTQHKGKSGAGGMGILIRRGAKKITISGVTAKKMWGDGFMVKGAKEVKFCSVIADSNRRQGLSIIDVKDLVVTDSIFKNTHGARPSAGIDLEPDRVEQRITDVRIENSKFLDNAGYGIQLSGKRGRISKVEITDNVFKGNRPILVENSPAVQSSSICRNRYIGQQAEQPGGLNAFADPTEIVALQVDCQVARDLRFEVNRNTKRRKKK
jgi:hypothetical protein